VKLPAQGLLAVGVSASATLLLLVAASGVILSSKYVPQTDSAHKSVGELVGWLGVLRGFQYWGGNIALLVVALTVFGMLWYGWWKYARVLWLLTLSLLCATFVAHVTGKPLPLSRHDARTIVVEARTAGMTPVVGSALQDWLLASDHVDDRTLGNWYATHRVSAVLAALLALSALVALYRSGHRLLGLATLAPTAIALIAGFLGAPVGASAQAEDLRGGVVSPMWYVIPLHALLRWSQSLSPGLGWIGVSAVPFALAALLFAMPWLSRSRWCFVAARGVALVGSLAVVAAYAQFGGAMQSPLSRAVPEVAPAAPAEREAVSSALVARGAKVFDRENCRSCHSLDGTGARGPGPALDGIGKRHPKRARLMEFLRDPAAQGATLMPAYDSLSEEDLTALAEFLRSQTD
jgi:quinol-cytochrome oxidoreductase complex cytochrome b subunit